MFHVSLMKVWRRHVSVGQPDDAPPPPEYLQDINLSPLAEIVPWFAHFNILQRWAFLTGIYNIADMESPEPGVCVMLIICLLKLLGSLYLEYLDSVLVYCSTIPHTATKVVFPNKTVDKLAWPETFDLSHLSTLDSSTHFSKPSLTVTLSIIHKKMNFKTAFNLLF